MPPTSSTVRRRTRRRRTSWPSRRLGAGLAVAAILALLAGPGMPAASAATRQAPDQADVSSVPTAVLAQAAAQAPTAGPAHAPSAGPVCGPALPGYATCQSVVAPVHWNGHAWKTGKATGRSRTAPPAVARAAQAGKPLAPFMAADLQSIYGLPSALLGGRQTIAIVDAYDNPNAEADLAAYRAGNDLPACDANFPCFTKVNQDGQAGPLPAPDPGWGLEESLDLDMASAICPNCRIVLVEANDNSLDSLGKAEDTAAKLGANVISNSFGGTEFTGQEAYAKYFDHPGVAVVASSGDFGFQTGVADLPAAFSTVTAVGGTTVYPSAGPRGWEESAWGSARYGAGSSCSAYVAKPAWQRDRLCPTRTVADVSAVADPATPVAIYDTYGTGGDWLATGGTSAAAPIIAGVYALAGNAGQIGSGAEYLYAHGNALFDVKAHPDQYDINSGSNGVCGSGYLCNAVTGYDGPTGNGTPNGIGAF